MKLGSARPLDRLVAEEPCYGAVFCSYTFDPAFFEEQVLRAVLRLTSDPQEQAPRFHDEAIRALQATPVACIVDAGMRQPGRRLPYDLLEVHTRVFHPKLVLLLFEEFARVQIGSGNLTRGGYGERTELFFLRDLRYEAPEDAALLRDLERFLADIAGLARTPGTQLGLVRDELARRLGTATAAAPSAPSLQILHSTRHPILPRFLALLPADARLTRVGVLAPFFERDDADAADVDEISSVLDALMRARPARSPALDLGLLWDDDPAAAPSAPVNVALEREIGRLWRWDTAGGAGKEPSVDYLTLTAVTAAQIQFEDRHGVARRRPRGELEAAIAEGRARPVQGVVAFAPRRIVERLRKDGADVHVWLHPARRREDGLWVNRPLHAKLFTVTVERRRQVLTYVLVGSPNASRRALLQDVEQGGNVELAVAFVLEGEHALADFAPALVHGRVETVEFAERVFPESQSNLAVWIESAIHDAEQRTLTVTWANEGPAPLGPFLLTYAGQLLASGDGPPGEPTRVEGFTLANAPCELVLAACGREFTIPILVRDLAMLPASAALHDLDLRELLALLGRRIGVERLAGLRSDPSSVGMESVLETIFGDGFGPVDVFKAWWGIAHDLAEPGLSAPALRAMLLGPLGAAAVWKRMREAVGVPDGLTRDEAWLYGAELLRTLAEVELPEDATAPRKREILAELTGGLHADLAALQPADDGRPWVQRILNYYGVAS
ncbi:phospholipase D family protein [Sorangium sp. So ce1335]|uniref:phospholipase D family protein n=1 Tax=Sorangium sp. So ce1335 TaxID=3133335 RepID=UPI003F5DE377